MTIPSQPTDASGGYVECVFSNGTNTHKHKFHIAEFADGTGVYTHATSSETTVADTVARYLSHVKNFYNSNWSLNPEIVWRRSGTPSIFTIQGFGVGGLVLGAGSVLGSQQLYVANQMTATSDTGTPNQKVRLIYLGFDQLGVYNAPTVTSGPLTGGSAMDALAAYLTGGDCNVVGHNGQHARTAVRFVRTFNHRLRRKYGQT